MRAGTLPVLFLLIIVSVSPAPRTMLHSHLQWMRDPVFPLPLQHLLLTVFFCEYSHSSEFDFIVVLIWDFLSFFF